jgi:glucosamine--fructose-6-phosphate aminotransferase (isomerizing)
MCGIFAYLGPNKNAPELVFEGIKLLEYRGYDSWGVSYIPKSTKRKIEIKKQIGKIGTAGLGKTKPSNIAIAHTRWATHGGVTVKNSHPHLDCTNKISVIHNGIVENYKELKTMLIKKGHKFESETDTEIIAHLIEDNLKKLPFNLSVIKSFKLITGSNAICAMDSSSLSIVACRNGSPLIVGLNEDKKEYFLGSDVPAFLKHTNVVHFLEDNEAVELSFKNITVWDINKEITKPFKPVSLDWQLEDAEKSGFPHFLIKEIYEQKEAIKKAANLNREQIKKVAALIKKSDSVILTGCGTAAYCALAGKYFLAENGIKSETYGAYEILPFKNSITSKSLIIAVSQSGETADTLIAVREAKKLGATIVSILNARGSTMERLSDVVLHVASGPEIAVVSTKAYTSQLSTLFLISKEISGNLDYGISELKNVADKFKLFLNKVLENKITNLSKKLMYTEHAYVIGKHINFPAALEFALKIKESAYLHAEAFTAGELKHGVITLIQKGTPCFVLTANDEVLSEVLSGAAELKARGGFIIGIGPKKFAEFDEFIEVPDIANLSIFPNVLIGQLLGYFLAIARGNDPDKPRNLAKSVTVK